MYFIMETVWKHYEAVVLKCGSLHLHVASVEVILIWRC